MSEQQITVNNDQNVYPNDKDESMGGLAQQRDDNHYQNKNADDMKTEEYKVQPQSNNDLNGGEYPGDHDIEDEKIMDTDDDDDNDATIPVNHHYMAEGQQINANQIEGNNMVGGYTNNQNNDSDNETGDDNYGQNNPELSATLQNLPPELQKKLKEQQQEEEKRRKKEEERRKEEEKEDARNYHEPIDWSKEGLYHTSTPDQNTEKFRWKLSLKEINENQKNDYVYSPTFEVGGYPWRILFYPRGNGPENYASVYLDTANNPSHVMVRFQITVLNQIDRGESHSQEADKKFTGVGDWGFREYIGLDRLYDPKQGFISDEETQTCILECVIHIVTSPYVLNPASYDSRKETGFIGLMNQGATCYMNSLLQTLYLISYFRKAVYKMPIDENDAPTDSVPLALMRVFYRLQYDQKGPVDTKELTKSFGWDTIDSFLQHDVQELARVLTDNLENKMDKTDQKDVMKELFEGKCKNYIKCINVDFESSRTETFYDLQLNVKGCKDVYESFDQYIEEETLEGENQYHAEGYGMQDAKKGTIFMKFPNVLMLHLKRFEYDFLRDLMYKINDRYEFPAELDLTKYLSNDSEQKDQDNTYILFSVLVHSGDVSGGHYYNFTRPYPDQNRWFKFEDEKVYEVDQSLALEDNYGGEGRKSKRFWVQPTGNSIYKKFTNAYMLLYIRKSKIYDMLSPVSDDDVPSHLRERFQRDEEERERKRREKQEALKFCTVKVVTNESLKNHHGPELTDFNLEATQFKFKKDSCFQELKDYIASQFGISSSENIRLWKWEKRKNKTFRPDKPVHPSDPSETVARFFHIRNEMNSELDFYVEITGESLSLDTATDSANTNEKQEVSDNEPNAEKFVSMSKEFLLYIKFYDPYEKKLQFLGTIAASANTPIKEYLPIFRKLLQNNEIEIPKSNLQQQKQQQQRDNKREEEHEMKNEDEAQPQQKQAKTESIPHFHADDITLKEQMESGSDLLIVEEVNPSMIEPIELEKTLKEAELQNGDIIVLQKSITEQEFQTLEYPIARSYYNYLQQRTTVELRELENYQKEGTQVELLRNMTYEQVVERLGVILEVDPLYIRLTGHHPYNEQPMDEPFRTSQQLNLKQMLTMSTNYMSRYLYYEILEEPITEVENKKELSISTINEKVEETSSFKVLLYPQQSVHDLTQKIIEREPSLNHQRLVIFSVMNHKIIKLLNQNDTVESIRERAEQLRAEILDDDVWAYLQDQQQEQRNGKRLLQIQHISKDQTSKPFGNPFLLIIQPNETFADVKKRIQEKLDVKDAEYARYKFTFLVNQRKDEYLTQENDNDNFVSIFDNLVQNGPADITFALEHKDPTPRSAKWYDKPIVIKN